MPQPPTVGFRMSVRPRLFLTMGDVAGIGPEIIARAWDRLVGFCRPVVVGDVGWLRKGLECAGIAGVVAGVGEPEEAEPGPGVLPCLAGSRQELAGLEPGRVHGAAGRAAYDFLCRAIDLTLAGRGDGIVTAPLNKEALRAGGVAHPGHTEILAERTHSDRFAMVLYGDGLGVIHVTLHVPLREAIARLSTEAVLEKTRLLDGLLSRLARAHPRLAVAGLNPHASDGGLFGDEEDRVIAPAVAAARAAGVNVSGPWPADTLFVRARRGEFDGVVAMYHDQGHIPMKLLAGMRAVNVTAGLPLVRTSVAHGTAYDIVGKGVADPTSLVEAARVAARLAEATPGSSSAEGRTAGGAGLRAEGGT